MKPAQIPAWMRRSREVPILAEELVEGLATEEGESVVFRKSAPRGAVRAPVDDLTHNTYRDH